MMNSLYPLYFPNYYYVLPFMQTDNTISDPRYVDQEPTSLENNRRCSRRGWTKEEDQQLLSIIKGMDLEGKRPSYRLIAKKMTGRTSKQIRERYLNTLDESIVKTPFTEEEDQLILSFFNEHGPHWKKLSEKMKGRTPTALKNRFNTKLRVITTQRSAETPLKLHQQS